VELLHRVSEQVGLVSLQNESGQIEIKFRRFDWRDLISLYEIKREIVGRKNMRLRQTKKF
jgi:hypothetical protein